MPAVSGANLTLLRTKQHKTRLHLACYHPSSMWTATVNGDHAAYATAITVAGAAGTTPVADYEVWFGSAAGLMDIGRSRVKSFAGVTLTIAPNNMDLAGGEFITVKQNIIPAAIQPNCGTTILENWDVAVGTDTTTYKPLARMGPPACAFIDDTTGLATVQFWSDSEALSGALTTWLWTTPSGTYTVGNANTAGTVLVPNVVTWNAAGQYWCSLKVTDSNSKVHTTYRPVFIFNRHAGVLPYSNIEIGSMEGSQESGGWTCALTVRGTADRTAFPELAQIVIFAEDYYGDTLSSIGGDYTWRENIVFVGFVRSGSVKAHSWNQTVELQAAGIGVFMEDLPGYASNLASGTPGGWHVLTGMTFKLGAYHIITEHSTIDHIADVDLLPIAAAADKLDFVASSLKDQVATQCIAPMRSVLGSSRLGRLYARQNPQLVAAAARTEPIVLDTDNADFRETIDITTERENKPVSQIDFNGYKFVATEQTPVLSLAPGVPWDSGKFERVDGIYIDTQANGNIISGYFEGRANNTYPEVSLRWRGNYRVFDPFPVEKIRLNLTASQNNRGIVWTGATIKTFWVKRVSFQYRAGILLVDTSVEADVVGNPGITGNYPTEPPAIPPPEPPEPITVDPTPLPPILPPGGTNTWASKVYFMADKRIFYSADFTGPGGAMPTWADVTPALLGVTMEKGTWMQPNPFDPLTTQYAMWYSTGSGDVELWKRASGVWSLIADTASLKTVAGMGGGDTLYIVLRYQCDINLAGSIYVLARDATHSKMYLFKSLNYGASWSVVSDTLPGLTNNSYTHFTIGYFKCSSPYAAGKVMYAVSGHGGGSSQLFYVSTNGGLTWTLASTVTNTKNLGFWGDVAQDVCYYWTTEPGGAGLYRSVDRASTWTKIFDSLVQGYYIIGAHGGQGMHCYSTANFAYLSTNIPLGQAQTIRFMASSGTDGSGTVRMYKSIDAGVTWTYTAIPATTTDATDIPQLGIGAVSIIYSAGSKLYVCRASGSADADAHSIYASDDDCVTMQGKAGTDRSLVTVTGIPYSEPCKFLLQVWTS